MPIDKEWTCGLHWSLEMLEKLLPPNLAARIAKDGSVDGSLNYEVPPNNGAYIYDGVTGKGFKDLAQPGQRIIRISRRKLRILCKEEIDIQWSHTLEAIICNGEDRTITASFTNGQKYTGTLLVGVDGPRSHVRTFLFGSDPVSQTQAMEEVVGMSMAVSYQADEARRVRAAHNVWCIALSPKLFLFISVQDVPDPERPETWKFFLFASWIGERDDSLSNEGRMANLKKRGATFAKPFRTAVLSIPDETHIPYSETSYWMARPWDTCNGLCTLAGDAAHPMPPFRGQGLNHAVLDAHNFVEMVKSIAATEREDRPDLQKKLMVGFTDEVAKRGAAETALSIKNGMTVMQYDNFAESAYSKQGLSRG